MSEVEIWVDIVGYEGRYQVSDFGRIKSLPKIIGRPDAKTGKLSETRILSEKQSIGRKGKPAYVRVNLGRDNTYLVHRLVGNAFVPNPKKKPTFNHKDGDKANNRASNLEPATFKENNNHAYKLGLNKPQLQNLKPGRR